MVVFTDIRYDYRVYREATTLAQAGHRVTVVSSAFSSSPLAPWSGVDVHLLPVDRTRSLRLVYPVFWRAAEAVARAAGANVYHAHDLDAFLPAARAARAAGAMLVYDSHELFTEQASVIGRPWVRWFWGILERRLIRQADRVLTVCDSIARHLERRYDLERVQVVRNVPPYRPRVTSDLLRQEFGLGRHTGIALYQGGFLAGSGLTELIEASAWFGEAILALVGSGPREAELRRLVRARQLGDRVRFLARVPFQQLHAYTCSADVGLCLFKNRGLSSYYSLPNKLFEYLMAGLPVVGSDFPEIAAVLRQGPSGALVAPNDPAAIGEAVRLLVEDQPRRQSYSEAALRAASVLNWEREAPRLLALYEGL